MNDDDDIQRDEQKFWLKVGGTDFVLLCILGVMVFTFLCA